MTKIGFKLEKINTEQFAIIEDSYDDCIDEVYLEANVKFGISSESESVISIIKFQFLQDKKPFLVVEASCEFSIEEKKWLEFSKGEKVVIPNLILTHFAMITVGTIRGILHSKTENSKFNEFLLPTVNVSQMILEDGEFEK